MSAGGRPLRCAAVGVLVPMQPKVLIICERAAERDTIRVLVGTMGCQWILASSLDEALPILGRERTSAALLELPGSISNSSRIHESVRELLVRFPGRVIALTEETPSAEISKLIIEYSIPSVSRSRLTVDLWPCLESMVYPHLGLRRIKEVARLVLDTFLRPLPAGVRFVQPDTRQLVYESQSLIADISFERPPGSVRTTLLGQIMRASEPRLPFNGVPVALKGRKGPLDLKMTNESGEFSFEFQNERSVTLEVEANPNEWVVMISPSLDWQGQEDGRAPHEPAGAEPASANGGRPLPKKKASSP